MRTLLLSDIHANAEALDAVLEHAAAQRYETVVFLGDAVGYGPEPARVLERLAELDATCIAGNHDAWLVKLADRTLNATALGSVGEVLAWQLARLDANRVAQLRAWPERATVPTRGRASEALLTHGSPRDPIEYVDSIAAARAVFTEWPGRLAFVGHTHVPGVFATLEGPVGEWVKHQQFRENRNRLVLPPRARWIANPGSVGQPRDGNVNASYGVFDDERDTFETFRVPYDVAATQWKIRAAKLPDQFAARLSVGR